MRAYRLVDQVIIGFSQLLRINQAPNRHRPSPATDFSEPDLTGAEIVLSGNLMRVNHCGEVCAQGLYLGQSLVATQEELKKLFDKAAQEELDHLQWCYQRLIELNTHPSYLNPLWFLGSFMLGAGFGLLGERLSLGFLIETETQVAQHLANHLERLPLADTKSQAILKTMHTEELAHANHAHTLPAQELPSVIKLMMRQTAKIMTTISYYL